MNWWKNNSFLIFDIMNKHLNFVWCLLILSNINSISNNCIDRILTLYSSESFTSLIYRSYVDIFCSRQLPVNIIKSFDPSSFFSSCITDSISFTRLSFVDSRDCKENHYRICWEFQCRICHQPNDPWKFQLRFWTLSFFLVLLSRGRAWPQSIVKVSMFRFWIWKNALRVQGQC